MPQSPLRLVKRCVEFVEKERLFELLPELRGMYVLYRERPQEGKKKSGFDVLYVGMATRGSIRARLKLHRRRKVNTWTHFSVFEVWDNVRDAEITELEGLFRHLYRRDQAANTLNKAKAYKAMRSVTDSELLSRQTRAPRRAGPK